MAYLEMALYTEAIKEFQVAARSEQLQLKSYEMIGNCFLLQNNPRLAVKQLLRGLDVAKTSGGDTLGIHYNLGLAYEMLEEDDRAREHFEEVYVIDITFRDIAEKMDKYSNLSQD
jgi:tetratricopeptide (TPR) repeat protein